MLDEVNGKFGARCESMLTLQVRIPPSQPGGHTSVELITYFSKWNVIHVTKCSVPSGICVLIILIASQRASKM